MCNYALTSQKTDCICGSCVHSVINTTQRSATTPTNIVRVLWLPLNRIIIHLFSVFHISYNNNQLPVTSDYGCILAMLLGSSRNGRLEMTQLSVPTTSGTVSVIQRDARCNTSRLTAPGSLNTCLMRERHRWYYCGTSLGPSLGLDPKDPANFGLKAC